MRAPLALLGALATATACYSLGRLVLAKLRVRLANQEHTPLAFLLGAALLHLAMFAVLVSGYAFLPVIILILCGAIAAGFWANPACPAPRTTVALLDSRNIPAHGIFPSWLSGLGRAAVWVAVFAYGAIYLVNAWAPEISPDGSAYHLAEVARYVREHRLIAITSSQYASLSQGLEMLFVPAFAIGRHSAASLLHLAFLFALGFAIWAFGRRAGKAWAGAGAALLVLWSPVAAVDAVSAYVDVAAAAAAFSVFYWIEIWDAERSNGPLAAAGLMGGYCYAIKYSAAVILLYAIGFVAWRTRKLKPLLWIMGCAALTAGPWLVWNWIHWHNPVAPFANSIFRNPFLHPELERSWREYLRVYEIKNFWELPLELTVRGVATQGLLGPVFLLAPVALLALRGAVGRRLLAAAALLMAVFPANIGTRFLIPSLPFVSLAMALALEQAKPVLALLVLAQAIAAWPQVIPHYAPTAWTIQSFPWKGALGVQSESEYLQNIGEYRVARMIDANVPSGSKVLALTSVAQSYVTRDIQVADQSTAGYEMLDVLFTAWSGDAARRIVQSFGFSEGAYRRIRIVQTGKAKSPEEQWSIQEIRFLHAGHELAPAPSWRMDAFPNPWGVRFAFDGSPVTRWRSWETAAPGMEISVNFGRDEVVDEVRLELAPDQWNIRLRVEGAGASGEWRLLRGTAGNQKLDVLNTDPRRDAIHQLRLRGVQYLLVRDGDSFGQSFVEDPASWGLTVVAREQDATLLSAER
jgi:hypothetical protein